jgi:hypothetical protein
MGLAIALYLYFVLGRYEADSIRASFKRHAVALAKSMQHEIDSLKAGFPFSLLSPHRYEYPWRTHPIHISTQSTKAPCVFLIRESAISQGNNAPVLSGSPLACFTPPTVLLLKNPHQQVHVNASPLYCYTLNAQPSTFNSQSSALSPESSTLNPQP